MNKGEAKKHLRREVKELIKKVLSTDNINKAIDSMVDGMTIDHRDVTEGDYSLPKDIVCAMARRLEHQWGAQGTTTHRASKQRISRINRHITMNGQL